MDYKKIKEDFDNGILDKNIDVLILDNDYCYLKCDDSSLSDDEKEKKYIEYEKRYGRGCGEFDLSKILTAFGIPNERC